MSAAWVASLFDLLLCGGLLWIAWQTVRARTMFGGVVLFMVFGLVMAVVWGRLGAPDLALAEAIIGAGIAGALLLNSCRAAAIDAAPRGAGHRRDVRGIGLQPWAALLCLLVGLVVAAVMVLGTNVPGPTAEMVRPVVQAHTLDNPVTVVLLDLRAYDTLLELVVLLAAFLAARVLVDQASLATLHSPDQSEPPMVGPLLGMATPILVLTGLYLFWAGSHSPGGAFQAGALLGALGVLYRLTGRLEPTDETPILLRILLIIGLLVFSLFAVGAFLWAPLPLTQPEGLIYPVVLAIELALVVSIASTLVLLFSATPGCQLPQQRGRSAP